MWRADIEVPNTTVYVNYWVVSACYPRGNFYPLSDDHSILNRLITKSCFRTCSTCWSRSQTPFIPLRSLNDFQPFWGNLWTPPLLFRRRPPQSNCPPDTVPAPDSRHEVRNSITQGWYSKVDSSKADALVSTSPTYSLHDLPNSNIKLQ